MKELQVQIEADKIAAMDNIKSIADEKLRLLKEREDDAKRISSSQTQLLEIQKQLQTERESVEVERKQKEAEAASFAQSKSQEVASQLARERERAENERLLREQAEQAAAEKLQKIADESRRSEALITTEAQRRIEEVQRTLEEQRRLLEEERQRRAELEETAERQFAKLSNLQQSEMRLTAQLDELQSRGAAYESGQEIDFVQKEAKQASAGPASKPAFNTASFASFGGGDSDDDDGDHTEVEVVSATPVESVLPSVVENVTAIETPVTLHIAPPQPVVVVNVQVAEPEEHIKEVINNPFFQDVPIEEVKELLRPKPSKLNPESILKNTRISVVPEEFVDLFAYAKIAEENRQKVAQMQAQLDADHQIHAEKDKKLQQLERERDEMLRRMEEQKKQLEAASAAVAEPPRNPGPPIKPWTPFESQQSQAGSVATFPAQVETVAFVQAVEPIVAAKATTAQFSAGTATPPGSPSPSIRSGMSLKQPARSISPTPSQRSAHNASLSQTPPRKTRQEIATETLRKITHDVSINLADIDLLAVTRDAIHPMPIPADVYLARTTCKGYLTKKGDIRRNWKKRWFSLSLIEMSITYYTDDTEAVQKGLIILSVQARQMQQRVPLLIKKIRTFFWE